MIWHVRRTPRRERLARKLQTVARKELKKRKKRVFVRGGDLTLVATKRSKVVRYEVHGRAYMKHHKDNSFKRWEELDMDILEAVV